MEAKLGEGGGTTRKKAEETEGRISMTTKSVKGVWLRVEDAARLFVH